MKIVEQGLSLSEDDLDLLRGTKIIETMMKNRLIVEFNVSPDVSEFDMSGCVGFYHIKTLGSKLFQFWFYSKADYDVFRENIIAYKMSTSQSDK